MSNAQKEKFARGFEQYLREGEAPTQNLQGVFERFKHWLTNVYKSASQLKADLTPEVRGVFDRMLRMDMEAKMQMDTPVLRERARVDVDFDMAATETFELEAARLTEEGRLTPEDAVMLAEVERDKAHIDRMEEAALSIVDCTLGAN